MERLRIRMFRKRLRKLDRHHNRLGHLQCSVRGFCGLNRFGDRDFRCQRDHISIVHGDRQSAPRPGLDIAAQWLAWRCLPCPTYPTLSVATQ